MLALFSTTALEVCEGQQLDMEFESRDQVTVSEYLEMIRLKTAVLIACSLKMGALLAGGNEIDCQLLYDFGIKIGIAFQLQDDWLDVYGDEDSFGKKIGGNICENKKTYLLLRAIELCKGSSLTQLKKWIALKEFDPLEKIGAVRDIYNSSGAGDETRNLMKYYHNEAIASLQMLNIPENEKSELMLFAGSVVDRFK